MKLALVLLMTLTVASAAEEKMPPQRNARSDSAFFQYVSDTARFKHEGSRKMTAEAACALRFAKSLIRAFVESEVQGEFLIAQEAWGFQVNFSGLKIKEAGVWTDAVEGFGQLYLSK